MASLADIRAGLRANLLAANVTDDVYLYVEPSPVLPCFEIDLDADGMDYDLSANRGFHLLRMIVRAVHPHNPETQITLDTYIDGAASTDVKAAIESDRTLGGAASNLQVTRVAPRRYKSESTGDILTCLEWAVTVYATGTS